MNRIDAILSGKKQQNRKVLSPYITAGDPDPQTTLHLMHALSDAGADIIELGIPFSDPMAEGPVIQAAMERALAHSVNCDTVFDLVKKFREKNQHTGIILMGYLNPLECYGYENFAKKAAEVGVDGTILVDLPPEEAQALVALWDANKLYSIFLCSPTTSKERMQRINTLAKGYLYYVSLKGVTGSNAIDLDSLKKQYQLRKSESSLPLLVGFGIKSAEQAAKIAEFADGVIVGAALIETILEGFQADGKGVERGAALIAAMREAIDK